jgi:CRISPR-associated endonuclease/helicase Cas3
LRLPRRLVYVVDRRTVVDQATDIAEALRSALKGAAPGTPAREVRAALERLCLDPAEEASPLAISTLRGEHADNGHWRADPARPAIIVGTVDMIGSRLLFSGYGVSRKMRPMHAGLLGQDALIVHDEAHLSPSFGWLIRQIRSVQDGAKEPRPIAVMDLSATQRKERGVREPGSTFALTPEEEAEAEVKRRLGASKTLRLVPLGSGGALAEAVAAQLDALEIDHPEAKRVIVYVRRPKDAAAIAEKLSSRIGAGRTAVLTGTIRGYERDQMADPGIALDDIPSADARRRTEIFRGFRATPGRTPPAATEYLVATSAGEVGVDLDADHMIADLATLDAMIQRLGRVNRLGGGAAKVAVIVPAEPAERLAATCKALQSLPSVDGGLDVSPRALRSLVEGLGADGAARCFAEAPRLLNLTDILLDGWALTHIETLPGRHKVDRWLHGVSSEPPSTYVAWRAEVDDVVEADDPQSASRTVFAKHPLLAREHVRGSSVQVFEVLRQIAKRVPKPNARRLGEREVVALSPGGAPEIIRLDELLRKEGLDRLRETTVVLPPDAGGLSVLGMLAEDAKTPAADVADIPRGKRLDVGVGQPERLRVLLRLDEPEEVWRAKLIGPEAETWLDLDGAATFRKAIGAVRRHPLLPDMRAMAEKARVVLKRDDEGNETRVLLLLTRRGSPDASEETQETAAREPVELDPHNRDVGAEAVRLATLVNLAAPLCGALSLAGERHDTGKLRPGWQKAIGNALPPGNPAEWIPWAKSNRRGFDDSECGDYRHEFGSLREAAADDALKAHPERDLILHLIAAHHGWARPHFEAQHFDIAEDVGWGENEAVAADAMRRYARLQRRFGRWGLAWLEALLRAADHRVSAGIAPDDEDGASQEVLR